MWISWRARAEAQKKAAQKTDQDLAVEVSDLVGYEVSRGLVNAWFRGRRIPTLPEVMALCAALGADPGEILFNVKIAHQYVPASDAAPALRAPAPTPEYLKREADALRKQSERVRRFKAKRRKVRIRV